MLKLILSLCPTHRWPAEPNDPDDIPAFAMETASTRNPHNECSYLEEEFLEEYCDQVNCLIAAEPENPLDIQLTESPL